MSRFANQPVMRMPPLSTGAINQLAEALVDQVAPQCLREPCPFPVLEVFENVLQNFGIDTYAVADDELPDAEAVTDHDGDPGDRITIRIRESAFDELLAGGRMALRHRATLPHELGHAALHVPVIRRRLRHPVLSQGLLARQTQSEMPVYEQSEWQAWTLSGCVLMPVRTLRLMPGASLSEVARAFDVSQPMAKTHIAKMTNANLLKRDSMHRLI